MDFVEAKAAAAREIALAFGVPPLLLGLPGDSTHANYAEANRAFYRQTIIPLVKRTAESLAHWLAPAFGEPLALEPDLDAIEALADERESLWRRVSAAAFLERRREARGGGVRACDGCEGEAEIKAIAVDTHPRRHHRPRAGDLDPNKRVASHDRDGRHEAGHDVVKVSSPAREAQIRDRVTSRCNCHPGAAQRSPGSITADIAERRATPLASP